MTTIITRVFEDATAAERVKRSLVFRGVPKMACKIIAAGENAHKQMERAKVNSDALSKYAKKLDAGNVVMVVSATYKPLGAARIVREVLARHETVKVAGVTDDYDVAWEPDHASSILKDHPHFFTVDIPGPKGPVTGAFGLNMLKAHKSKSNLMAHDKRMSRMFWPMKLVSRKNRSSSVMSGGRHMSKMFWPMKLISSGERSKSVIPGGGHPFSNRFRLRLLSQ